MTPTKPDADRWLLDVRGRALEWVARQPQQAETETYARLMFAFGLARVGVDTEASWVAAARAVRSAPLATADACFRKLFAGLPPIRDTYTTSTHYGVSVLTVVEAVCLSAAEVAGRMMHE